MFRARTNASAGEDYCEPQFEMFLATGFSRLTAPYPLGEHLNKTSTLTHAGAVKPSLRSAIL